MTEATETENALIAIIKLMIGANMVAHPERQQGVDDGLKYLRDSFTGKGKQQAAAVVEYIRQGSSASDSEAGRLNALRQPPKGSA